MTPSSVRIARGCRVEQYAALMRQRAVHIEAGQAGTSPMPSGPES